MYVYVIVLFNNVMICLVCMCVVVVFVELIMEFFIGIWYFVFFDVVVVIKFSIYYKYM